MNTIPYHHQLKDDIDLQETAEWLEALVAVMEREGITANARIALLRH